MYGRYYNYNKTFVENNNMIRFHETVAIHINKFVNINNRKYLQYNKFYNIAIFNRRCELIIHFIRLLFCFNSVFIGGYHGNIFYIYLELVCIY